MGIALIAFGGFILFEGFIWACFPAQMRELYSRVVDETKDRELHIAGLISVFIGAALLVFGIKVGIG